MSAPQKSIQAIKASVDRVSYVLNPDGFLIISVKSWTVAAKTSGADPA